MTDAESPYYAAYEDRYRSVYAQGVEYWCAFPEELKELATDVRDLVAEAQLPPGAHVVEFGCGEGYVGELLAASGYRYTGLDVAASAVAKARRRLAPYGQLATVLVGDALDPHVLPGGAFDAAVDARCLHMLVVDADRQAYLRNAFRALKPGARMLLSLQLHRGHGPAFAVRSYEHWLKLAGEGYGRPERRVAWQDGRKVKVWVPSIAARGQSAREYAEELRAVGFAVLHWREAMGGACVSLLAAKPGPA